MSEPATAGALFRDADPFAIVFPMAGFKHH